MQEVTTVWEDWLLVDAPAKKFNPKFLHELVDDLYENESDSVRSFAMREFWQDGQIKGQFWERVLEKHMPHTSRCLRNTAHMDYYDWTDAKFASACRYKTTGVWQATISNVATKIGTLRVCLSLKGTKFHKLYFMLIPHSYYSKLSGHPIKITFKNFAPYGDIWDKFQCSFEEVTQEIV
jgi:hypothetical protein